MAKRPDTAAPSGPRSPLRFGRYDLLRPLGKGGMAEVFLARYAGPEGFEKRLVIKRVLPRLSDDPGLLRMFFEEAKTQVSFSHGNLVSVFDFGRVGNDHFIAMEYVPGVDLASLLAAERSRGETLSAALVAFLGIELCRALGYVHRRGFVHRDVSPRNVLLSVDGEVKLSDFGLALALESADRPGTRGTPSYMAPEQTRGERVDARADLYALGMVLAEALDGAKDGPLTPVLSRAIQAEASERFAGADEMLAALEQQLAGAGVTREGVVRELAGKVGALGQTGDRAEPSSSPRSATRPTAAEEASARDSYFRDHRSETFVDEVLGPARPLAGRRSVARLWAPSAIAAAIAIGLGLSAVGIGRRGAGPADSGRRAPASAAPASPSSTPVAEAPRPNSAPGPGGRRVIGEGARRPTARDPEGGRTKDTKPGEAKRGEATRAGGGARPSESSVPSGSLTIRCTPWCVPYLDGQPRGQDGRTFVLRELRPGAHRVEGRRLDDRQERIVEVRPGGHETVELFFE